MMPESSLPTLNASGVIECNVDGPPLTPTFGSNYDSPSAASSSERPRRHPSAGRKNAKKIPWEISSTPTRPKQRSVAGDSPDNGSDADRNSIEDSMHSR
jgi:hypothetical protein